MTGSDDVIAIEAAEVWPDDVDETVGIVANWFVREGASVTEGNPICELQVEKVSVDVPAPVSGTLVEITCGEDEEITVEETLGRIESE